MNIEVMKSVLCLWSLLRVGKGDDDDQIISSFRFRIVVVIYFHIAPFYYIYGVI